MRRLKREVMGQLPAKRRQVVRLPRPAPQDWPASGAPPAPPCVSVRPRDEECFENMSWATRLNVTCSESFINLLHLRFPLHIHADQAFLARNEVRSCVNRQEFMSSSFE